MSDPDEGKPSYLVAMLTSQVNLTAGLVTAALGTLLSFNHGLAGFVVPLIGFGALETLAALYIPSMSTFRHKVDKKWRAKRRVEVRMQLMSELHRTDVPNRDWDGVVHRMLEIAESLSKLSGAGAKGIGAAEAERVEDAANDYMRLTLAQHNLEKRARAVDVGDLDERIRDAEEARKLPGSDRVSLDRALKNFRSLRERHGRLASRRTAVDAALLALPDAAEEIYLAATTSSTTSNAGPKLHEALERLRLNEEVSHSLDLEVVDQIELDPVPLPPQSAMRAARRVAQKH